MGKIKPKKAKKKSSGVSSPSGSVSPVSSSSNEKGQQLPEPSVSKSPLKIASAVVNVSGSAENSHVSLDLGVKPASPTTVSRIKSIQSCDASATVLATSSVIAQTKVPSLNLGLNASATVHKVSSANTELVTVDSCNEVATKVGEACHEHVPQLPATNKADAVISNSTTQRTVSPPSTQPAESNEWVGLFKSNTKRLSKKGEAFILPSGEACVKIPNSIIEKNMKSWESFIIGQFYADPPPQALIHPILNGIWSPKFKDIAVSKLDGNAFLFRIPNSQTRRRVVNQRLWQVEGQTMFVGDWEPGTVPVKPELTSAPIWLELRDVPLQFFHEDGLELIVGLVGDPNFFTLPQQTKQIWK
ncbi:PREDICTED: uncharacterized protein LOC104701313 [Camelina sativa]|uniref:Uncharacterized protein LOC104701313 n=1 Tax=Camelina sativa TaxID=90675 RepID=A0ABM0SRX3_CAMSA|nr:PREDICTED: uncharacterized protein LOC104701313 [Camelina sativa]